jgi:hypothetical protein
MNLLKLSITLASMFFMLCTEPHTGPLIATDDPGKSNYYIINTTGDSIIVNAIISNDSLIKTGISANDTGLLYEYIAIGGGEPPSYSIKSMRISELDSFGNLIKETMIDTIYNSSWTVTGSWEQDYWYYSY